MIITHLGINIKDKPSNHINKELYLSAKPEGLPGWTEDHYAKQIANILNQQICYQKICLWKFFSLTI